MSDFVERLATNLVILITIGLCCLVVYHYLTSSQYFADIPILIWWYWGGVLEVKPIK